MENKLQGTAEWHQARLGKVTASNVFGIIPLKRGNYPATRERYMMTLLTERLTGAVVEQFVSKPMQWGIDTEPLARSAYEAHTGQMVMLEGFVNHKSIAMFGASPDGLVGDDGLTEYKCPESINHAATLSGAEIKPQYMYQMQTQMLCTGRKWCDFVSFDPRFPPEYQLSIHRVPADKLVQELIIHEVKIFLEELDALEASIRGRHERVE